MGVRGSSIEIEFEKKNNDVIAHIINTINNSHRYKVNEYVISKVKEKSFVCNNYSISRYTFHKSERLLQNEAFERENRGGNGLISFIFIIAILLCLLGGPVFGI